MGCSSSTSQSAFIPKLASKPACHPYSTFTFLAKDKVGNDYLLTDILNHDHELETVSIKDHFEQLNYSSSCIMLKNENKVLSSGGVKNDQVTAESYLVDLQENKIFRRGSLNTQRRGHRMIQINQYVLTIGGHNKDNSDAKTIEYLDVENPYSEWERSTVVVRAGLYPEVILQENRFVIIGYNNEESKPTQIFTVEFNLKKGLVMNLVQNDPHIEDIKNLANRSRFFVRNSKLYLFNEKQQALFLISLDTYQKQAIAYFNTTYKLLSVEIDSKNNIALLFQQKDQYQSFVVNQTDGTHKTNSFSLPTITDLSIVEFQFGATFQVPKQTQQSLSNPHFHAALQNDVHYLINNEPFDIVLSVNHLTKILQQVGMPLNLKLYHKCSYIRAQSDLVVIVGGRSLTKTKEKSAIFLYQVEKGIAYKSTAKMNQPRFETTLVAIGDQIFVIGGCFYSENRFQESVSNHVEVFNLETEEIVQKSELKIPRKGHSASFINGKIFVVGGMTIHGDLLDSIEYFNLISEQWNFVEMKICKPLIHFSLVVTNPTDILLIGGNTIVNNYQEENLDLILMDLGTNTQDIVGKITQSHLQGFSLKQDDELLVFNNYDSFTKIGLDFFQFKEKKNYEKKGFPVGLPYEFLNAFGI